jgi:hypothetical protein
MESKPLLPRIYTMYPGVAQVPADTWLAERSAESK